MKRENWGSKLGFMLAAVGSAIGLANIVIFPYLVGKHGGAAFIVLYLMCLLLVGFPVFLSEIVIGRHTKLNPRGSFKQLGKNKLWEKSGVLVVLTGFIVSAFYSALAGWILGYLVESIAGNVHNFNVISDAKSHYNELVARPVWGLGFHALFLLACAGILYSGVKQGLERFSKILMPLLFLVLTVLVIVGISLPGSIKGLNFLIKPDWYAITPTVVLLALGQAFFTLSAGQGTMITYGSYLPKSTNLLTGTIPIVLADTLVALMSVVVVFTIVFSAGLEPNSGIGLIFHTLPVVFSKLSFGYILGIAFFLLVTLAAITSEVSAMEPAIAYLMDENGFSRHKAVATVSLGAFALGIPCALSYSLLKDVNIFSLPILEFFSFTCNAILIPFGAFVAVLLVGWFWGLKGFFNELNQGSENTVKRHTWLTFYLKICIKLIAPISILIIAAKTISS